MQLHSVHTIAPSTGTVLGCLLPTMSCSTRMWSLPRPSVLLSLRLRPARPARRQRADGTRSEPRGGGGEGSAAPPRPRCPLPVRAQASPRINPDILSEWCPQAPIHLGVAVGGGVGCMSATRNTMLDTLAWPGRPRRPWCQSCPHVHGHSRHLSTYYI